MMSRSAISNGAWSSNRFRSFEVRVPLPSFPAIGLRAAGLIKMIYNRSGRVLFSNHYWHDSEKPNIKIIINHLKSRIIKLEVHLYNFNVLGSYRVLQRFVVSVSVACLRQQCTRAHAQRSSTCHFLRQLFFTVASAIRVAMVDESVVLHAGETVGRICRVKYSTPKFA